MDDPDDTKPLKDYAIPTKEEPHCSIVHPLIAANNFELKPSLIGMVQQNKFSSLPSENQNLHLSVSATFRLDVFCMMLKLGYFSIYVHWTVPT